MPGIYRSTVKGEGGEGGARDCAPGTILKRIAVLKLGLGIRGNGSRGACAAKDSTECIHCIKECEFG
jgi:hypothetical protein